jgi:hypothetical protein
MSHLIPNYAKFSAENKAWECNEKQAKCEKRDRDQATEDGARCNLSIANCGNRYSRDECKHGVI